MKKTQVKELLRSIRKTWVTFLSVAVISGISVAVFLGTGFAGESMKKTADDYFRGSKLHNFEISCANGITQNDVKKLKSLENVTEVEGAYTTNAVMPLKKENRLIKVISLTNRIDKTSVIKGHLPSKIGEVAIEKDLAKSAKIHTGDTIILNSGDKNKINYLYKNKFKVTAIVKNPAYVNGFTKDVRGTADIGNGANADYVVVPKAAFNPEKFDNCYTNVFVSCSSLNKYKIYSVGYKNASKRVEKNISKLGRRRAEARYDAINNEANAKIARMKKLLSKSKIMSYKAISKPEKHYWTILDRESNYGYSDVQFSSKNIGGMSMSFALVFIVVAILVCYTSIGRMITEQRILIGAQKALGFTKGEIMLRYLVYSSICAIAGSVIGWLIGAFIFEKITLLSYVSLYIFDTYPIFFDWGRALIVTAVTIFIAGLSTYIACNKLVKDHATNLLRGEMPSSGKEMFFERKDSWKSMPLYSRAVIKNLFNDKKRLFMTIIGVAGCTSLMVISLTLKLAVSGVPNVQFKEIFKFDKRLYTDSRGGENVTNAFAHRLDKENGLDYIKLQDKMFYFRANNSKWSSAHVIAAHDDEYLSDYLSMVNIKNNKSMAVPAAGALISKRASEVFGIEKGDYIQLMDSSGELHPVEVAGIFDNHSYHIFIMNADYYKKVMGEPIDDSAFYINLHGHKDSKLAQDLSKMKGYLNYESTMKERKMYDDISNGITSVVLLFLTLSAIMAIMVLLNLCVMFINQKVRELTVMRVNGFTLKETRAYIYRDNIILTIIGLIVGTITGIVLARWIIMSIEEEVEQFVRQPSIEACVLACGVSAFFMLIVNLIALRKINKLKLYNVNAN